MARLVSLRRSLEYQRSWWMAKAICDGDMAGKIARVAPLRARTKVPISTAGQTLARYWRLLPPEIIHFKKVLSFYAI